MPEIILYHYKESLFSQRILWYLKLRNLPYHECIQPPYMPRPDPSYLGISYRRIPILSIGRDVYCDSRRILQELEKRYPLVEKSAFDAGLQLLFQFWTHSSVFPTAVGLLPTWSAFVKDPAFLADRSRLAGVDFSLKMLEQHRPAAMSSMQGAFQMLETTFLADGRLWIAGGTGPTAADIEAIFPFWWLTSDLMEGTLEASEVFILKEAFPKTFAWIERFQDAVRGGTAISTLDGAKAAAMILAGAVVDNEGVLPNPLGLKAGGKVRARNIEQATENWDEGALVSLSHDEVCIENAKAVRLHFPRLGYLIESL